MMTGEDNQSSMHIQEVEKVLECGRGIQDKWLCELIK